MEKHKFIIGIDPDCDKSGLAWINIPDNDIQLYTLKFPDLIEMVCHGRGAAPGVIVVVEASWINGHHNWHSKTTDSRHVSSSKGYDIGRNHETGRKIVEMCKSHGIEVIELPPLRKLWKAKDGKISHEELEYFVPGLPKRTNQEQRDAMLMAWNVAGKPIKIKPRS